MKYTYPSATQAVIQQLLNHPGEINLNLEQRNIIESEFGYQLLPALQILSKLPVEGYVLCAEELIQMTLHQKNRAIAVASVFVKLHAHHSLNDPTVFLLIEEKHRKHADVILDFLSIVELQQPRLISTRFFTDLCNSARFLDDEDVMNSFFERYYRLGKQNSLSLDKISKIFAVCHASSTPSTQTKQALLALSLPKRQSYDLSFLDDNTDSRERAMVDRWDQNYLFNTAIQRPGRPKFVTYDGPPFATGLPHYGHVLAMSIKSAISAHKALSGFDVETRFGWDCHGVPVEMIVQKKLGLDSHKAIMKMGTTNFNNECRQQIFKCVDAWEHDTKRMGRFIDMGLGNDYRTMDVDYMSSVWGVFGKLYNKDLIYKGFKVVPYSPSLGTVLSDFEAGLEYKKIISPSITLTFPLQGEENTQFLVWTTTPWSIPANVAVAVNPQFAYVKVHTNDSTYIMLKSRYQDYFKKLDEVRVEDIDIRDYLDRKYQPVFDSLPNTLDADVIDRCYRVVESAHVTEDNGTGCVHICPAYGVDDHKVGERHGLPVVDFIDANGLFKEVTTRDGQSLGVAGLYFKYYKNPDEPSVAAGVQEIADSVLLKQIKSQQRLFRNDTIHHEYPLCWRTHSPLMYRAVESWFVKVTSFKEELINNNAKVKWAPEAIGSTRFENWLKSAHDWAISRTRYWGCPIPVWVAVDDPSDVIVVDSKQMLENLTGMTFEDLHREHIDDIEIVKEGKRYRRITEVLDCWFESGSMPYAQYGLTFKGDEDAFIHNQFPADFIAEGLDQTRGWFYALSVIGTALFGKIPFRNVIVNGILLGNNGKKMSKSEGNYPPIHETFTRYGADVMRLFLLGSPAVRADSVAIKDESFRETNKNYIIPLLNIYRFFATSANTHGVMIDRPVDVVDIINNKFGKLNPFDAWLVYRVELYKQKMFQHLEAYDLLKGSQQMKAFILDLTDWYVRVSRTRVDRENPVVLYLLHYALDVFSYHAAPYTPFIAESIHLELYPGASSIHLESYPAAVEVQHLEREYQSIEQLRQIYTMVLALREEHRLRLRQPIDSIYLDEELATMLQPHENILKVLCNCKTIHWVNSRSSTLFDRKVHLSPDLGARLKRQFKPVKDAFSKQAYRVADDGETLIFEHGHTLSVHDKEFFYVVETNHPDFAYKSKGENWVLINTQLNPELIQEGWVRDVMRELVKLRIAVGYSTHDVMELSISETYRALVPQLEALLQSNKYRLTWTQSAHQSEALDAGRAFSVHTFNIGERGGETISLAHRKVNSIALEEDYSGHRFFKEYEAIPAHSLGVENVFGNG
ncbi:MAG: isoleucine--tRNA ligase [Gammaproteobacteria bacterium]|nr:isoleucine--tRNA ligase [Gammaproteobacteria bacterium]